MVYLYHKQGEVNKMTTRQNKYYKKGQELAQQYETEFEGFRGLVRKLVEENEFDLLDSLESGFPTNDLWLWAGYRGYEPEYKTAQRFGRLPENGRSRNHADNTLENGVSVIGFGSESSLYDVILGWQGIEKVNVSGWYLGQRGSDGEPLLVDCKEV